MASVEVQKQIVEEAKSVSELISDALNVQLNLNELNAEYLHTVLANVFPEEINVE